MHDRKLESSRTGEGQGIICFVGKLEYYLTLAELIILTNIEKMCPVWQLLKKVNFLDFVSGYS